MFYIEIRNDVITLILFRLNEIVFKSCSIEIGRYFAFDAIHRVHGSIDFLRL